MILNLVGRYTLVVSVEERTAVPVVAAVGLPSHNLDGEMPTYLKPKRPVVNIYDLKNKIICGTAKKFQLQLNEKVEETPFAFVFLDMIFHPHIRSAKCAYAFLRCCTRSMTAAWCT